MAQENDPLGLLAPKQENDPLGLLIPAQKAESVKKKEPISGGEEVFQ